MTPFFGDLSGSLKISRTPYLYQEVSRKHMRIENKTIFPSSRNWIFTWIQPALLICKIEKPLLAPGFSYPIFTSKPNCYERMGFWIGSHRFWDTRYEIRLSKGACTNHVDKIWEIFDSLPPAALYDGPFGINFQFLHLLSNVNSPSVV